MKTILLVLTLVLSAGTFAQAQDVQKTSETPTERVVRIYAKNLSLDSAQRAAIVPVIEKYDAKRVQIQQMRASEEVKLRRLNLIASDERMAVSKLLNSDQRERYDALYLQVQPIMSELVKN